MKQATVFLRFVLLLFCLAAILPGCSRKAVPMMELDGSIPAGSYSRDELVKAFVRAGSHAGWVIAPQEPGVLLGTVTARSHQASVLITHTTKAYHIAYKDSVGLKADGNNIHPNYNRWVRNLDAAIQKELPFLSK